MDRSIVWYLCGPMSGRPQFNIPRFDEAAEALRARGYEVVSPAELDYPAIRAACLASADGASTPETHGGGTWADFLARDVKLIADKIGGIMLLKGWQGSRGARLEAFVGLLCGKQFAEQSVICRFTTSAPRTIFESIPTDYVRDDLRRSMP